MVLVIPINTAACGGAAASQGSPDPCRGIPGMLRSGSRTGVQIVAASAGAEM